MPSISFGGGGTSTNGASYTDAAWVRTAVGTPTGNLNITLARPVTYDSLTINGSYSNAYPYFDGYWAYLIRSGGVLYFSRYRGNGVTVEDSTGYVWTNGSLQGTLVWSTVPAAIGTPTATASTNVQGRIALSWTAPDNGGAGISNYRIFYEESTNNSEWSAKTEVTKTVSTATSFSVDSLTVGRYYRFYVNAVNSRGTANYSTVSAVQMAPGVPYGLDGLTATRSTATLGAVNLSWSAPSVTAGGITGYNVYANPAGGARVRIATLTGTGTTYIATGLTERLSYTFDVTARNAFVDATSIESGRYPFAVAVASGVPSAPTLTTVVPTNTDFTLNLSWTVPTDTSGSITGYNIYRTTSNSVYATTATGTTTYSATDLVPGVAYSFFVRARNALSDAASTVGVASNTTTNTPTGEPSAPSEIAVSTISQVAGAIRFTWIPTVDTVSVNIYENTLPLTLIATVKGASYTIYGLTSGIERSYVLSTNNAFGESLKSSVKTITPTSGSTQTLISTVAVTDATNDLVFNGTYNVVSVGSNTFTYARTNANIAETIVPVISGTTTFGEINNNTNDNISATAVAIITPAEGPASSSFSYTRTVTGTLGDIPSGTPVSSVVAINTTNALFNGTKVVAVPSAGTITYTVASATVSSRVASGTVTNKSNSTYNGIYFVTGATETEFTYNALTTGNTDQATSASYGAVTNLTNKNMYNADSLTVSGSPAYNKITYSPAPTAYNARAYSFSATTTASDPGSGTFRLNSGTVASANRIYIDVLDSNGTNRATWIRDWDLSTASVKGRLIIKSNSGASTTIFTVTGATTLSSTTSAGYFTGVITYVSGALPTVGASTITFIPEQSATVITPYGQIRKANSTAKLDVRYRSGWLG